MGAYELTDKSVQMEKNVMTVNTLRQTRAAHAIAALVILLSPAMSLADLYGFPETGTLSWTEDNSELYATEAWAQAGTTITWTLSQNADGSLHYAYTFAIAEKKALSHLILQVSPGFDVDEERDYFGGSGYTVVSEPYSTDGNPGIPAVEDDSWRGLKFEGFSEAIQWTIEFDSYRLPMWGDFYAKDGKDGGDDVIAYNSSFGDSDGLYKIVVPDTAYVPIPGAVLLGVLGLGAAGLGLRRQV